jgi:hypothetical protein
MIFATIPDGASALRRFPASGSGASTVSMIASVYATRIVTVSPVWTDSASRRRSVARR